MQLFPSRKQKSNFPGHYDPRQEWQSRQMQYWEGLQNALDDDSGSERPQSISRWDEVADSKRNYEKIAIWSFAGLFFLGLSWFAWVENTAVEPFVLVDLKAISQEGRPIAGALVKIKDRTLGSTDSFGEWRRFIRAKPGERVAVLLEKEKDGRSFDAKTIIRIPKSAGKEGNFEVSAKVTMLANEYYSRSVLSKDKNDSILNSKIRWNSVDLRYRAVSRDKFSENNIKMANYVEGQVFHKVRQSLSAGGIVLNQGGSNIKLRISYLPLTTKKGVIRSDLSFGKNKRRYSWLTSIKGSDEKTARNLIAQLQIHVPRPYSVEFEDSTWKVQQSVTMPFFWQLGENHNLTDKHGMVYTIKKTDGMASLENFNKNPCGNRKKCILNRTTVREAPPYTAWKPLKLRVFGELSEQSEVFINGYQAIKKSPEIWEFWGPVGRSSYVVVTDNRGVIAHQKIVSRGMEMPFVSVPSNFISRR